MIRTQILHEARRCEFCVPWNATAVACLITAGGPWWDVCVRHLDSWLTKADDNPVDEPAGLVWLLAPNQRVCVVHLWPAVLCRGWEHVNRVLTLPKLASSIPIEKWQVGQAEPGMCRCARPACTGCSPLSDDARFA